jgi:hypothetical protein
VSAAAAAAAAVVTGAAAAAAGAVVGASVLWRLVSVCIEPTPDLLGRMYLPGAAAAAESILGLLLSWVDKLGGWLRPNHSM